MLLEPEAKAVQKSWRPSFWDAAACCTPAGHHGGFPANTLSVVSFRVGAHFLALKQRGMSGGAMFLDCKAAYYSIVRDLLALPAGSPGGVSHLQQRADLLSRLAKAAPSVLLPSRAGY